MAVNQPLQQRKPNQTATGYTNIQRILQANKSNQLGSTVAGGVNQAGQAARGAINQAGEQFKAGVDKENERLAGQKATADRVLSNVIGATKDDVKAFEDIRSGKSQGPTGIMNADEIQKKTREAETLGSAAGSEGGRYGLLQRFVGGNKQYTGGQQRVDNMLLGQTGADQLRSARQNTLGLRAAADTQEAGAREVGKTLQNQARNLADTTINRLGEQVMDYDSAMEQARLKAQEELKALQAQQQEQLRSGIISDDNLFSALGINEGDQLWRTNLADYYQAMNNVATKQNAQTQEDFNRINALQRLSGNSLTGQASAVLPTYSDRSQIDAFKNMDTFKYDQDALAGKLASEKGLYQGAVAPHERNIGAIDNFLNNTGFGYAGYNEGMNIVSNRLADDVINLLTQSNHIGAADKRQYYNSLPEFQQANQLSQDLKSGKITPREYAEKITPLIAPINQILNPTLNGGARQLDHGNIQMMLQTMQQQEAARKANEDAITGHKGTYQFDRTLRRG